MGLTPGSSASHPALRRGVASSSTSSPPSSMPDLESVHPSPALTTPRLSLSSVASLTSSLFYRPSILQRPQVAWALLVSCFLSSFLLFTSSLRSPSSSWCTSPDFAPSNPLLQQAGWGGVVAAPQASFSPPSPVSSCFCSAMYDMQSHPASTWPLLPGRSYDEADACPMVAPRSALLHSAPPIPGPAPDNRSEPLWQAPPCMAFDVWLRWRGESYLPPVYSLQYTLFNQEANVVSNLHAMLALANPREPFELVVVFDDCSDSTIARTHAFLHALLTGCGAGGEWPQEDIPSFPYSGAALSGHDDLSSACLNPGLVHVRTLVQPTGVWETAANNLGARAAAADAHFLVFVQDDHVIEQRDWNAVMALPLRVWPSDGVIAVSGRCGESKWSRARIELGAGWVGRCNVEIGEALKWEPERRCVFYIRDSINRGPLLISHAALRALGYFDEVHFYMDDSDHDLFARAYHQTGALVGVIAFDFRAPYDQGGTRKPKPPRSRAAESYIRARKERAQRTQSALDAIHGNFSQVWVPHDENRPLPGSVLHRCVDYYRSGGRNNSHWYDAVQLHREGRGFAGGQMLGLVSPLR